jgi:hypothetical protein
LARIVIGSEENFQNALNNRGDIEVKLPKSLRAFGNQDKLKNAAIMQKTGFLETARNAPLFNDPRYTSSTLAIPTDERSLHGLYRFFTETDPIVGAGIKILSELPLASLRLGICEDTGVQQHYEEQWERINGFKLVSDAVSEYHEIGTVGLFGAYNETDYMWNQFAILNPDYLKIESTWINEIPLIKLIPDEALKKIIQTQSPRVLYEQIPTEIKRYVMFNQEIPLDPNNTFLLTHAKRPYETKGRSVIKRILKILMLEDRFNQANFALATRHAVPFTVAKVGDPNLAWLPSDDDLKDVQDAISAFELDPNFTFITHPGFNIQYYGSNGRALPVGPELDRIYRLKFIGLGVHEQLLAGQGGSYSQAYMSMEVQRQRSLNLQLKVEQLFHNGIFKPVADMCGFFRVKQATAGYKGITKVKYGKEDKALREIKKAYTYVDDYQNPEFKEFINRKVAEYKENQIKTTKEYVYPKLDFGALSAAYDENMKNYVKWMHDKYPELVDSGLIARLAKLDRDDQLKAKINDVRRMQQFYAQLQKEGLLDMFMQMNRKGGAAGGGDLGPLDIGTGGALNIEGGPGAVGGEPGLPIGEGGPPEAAEGQTSPAMQGTAAAEETLIKRLVFDDDKAIMQENKRLLRNKK